MKKLFNLLRASRYYEGSWLLSTTGKTWLRLWTVAGLLATIPPAPAHEIIVYNATDTNQQVSLDPWTWILRSGEKMRIPNVDPGSVIVSTNGGWSWAVDDLLPTTEPARASLMLGFSNGVLVPVIEPAYGPKHYVNLGKWMAFTFVGFAMAMSLARYLKSPSKETD